MEKLIPINGRIAIIDDNIKEAVPLMKVFAKNNIPYVYYKGNDIKWLPNNPENDIRILFLDINLGSESATYDQILGSLKSTFRKIISEKNYPYILIFWSKEEDKFEERIKNMFEEELNSLSPIFTHKFIKSDFFTETGEEKDCDKDIIIELNKIIKKIPPHSYMMQWENSVHNAADLLLKDLLPNVKDGTWADNTNKVLTAIGKAYMGQHYDNVIKEEKIKAAYQVWNEVFFDTLENVTSSNKIEESEQFVENENNLYLKDKINTSLLISNQMQSLSEPGCVLVAKSNIIDFPKIKNRITGLAEIIRNRKAEEYDKLEKSINEESCINEELRISFKKEAEKKRVYLQQANKSEEEIEKCIEIEHKKLIDRYINKVIKDEKNKKDKEIEEMKNNVLEQAINICIVVTASCDYAQNKVTHAKIIQGCLIPAEIQIPEITKKTESLYHSDVILLNNKRYRIGLDLSHFYTTKSLEDDYTFAFKVRRQLLANIQTKLASHISRQGLLSV